MVKFTRESTREAKWLASPFMYYGDYAQFLHRALAAPDVEAECPDMPTLDCGADHDQEAIYYWEGAYYLLIYLLGWSNPGRGLLWYYRNQDEAIQHPALRLLRDVYESNGQLALLAAWLWRHENVEPRVIRRWASGAAASQWNDKPVDPGPEWWRQFESDYEGGKWKGWLPYGGGSSPLHLGHVLHVEGRSEGKWIVGDKTSRRAALLIDGTGNWYHTLCKCGRDLPELGQHSWHVEVVQKQLGWLGTFRRSRETGLWFQGNTRFTYEETKDGDHQPRTRRQGHRAVERRPAPVRRAGDEGHVRRRLDEDGRAGLPKHEVQGRY